MDITQIPADAIIDRLKRQIGEHAGVVAQQQVQIDLLLIEVTRLQALVLAEAAGS